MPRQKRADEAGCIYHVLNRGNARQAIFHKDEDYEAFLRVLGEGLQRYPVEKRKKGRGGRGSFTEARCQQLKVCFSGN